MKERNPYKHIENPGKKKLEVMLLYLSDVSTEIKLTFCDIVPDTLQESEL